MKDNKHYKLTIITTVRNILFSGRKECLRQCVESVRKQKISGNIEHLIVDGGSTDGTMELLRKYEVCGWIKLVSKPDTSVYEGMNNGLTNACGDYVLFLNSDDYLLNDANLGNAMKALIDSEADFCYGDVEMIMANGHKRILSSNIEKLPFAEHFCHQSMIAKTKVLRTLNGFNTQYKICADNDLTMRLIANGYSCIRSRVIFSCYRDGGISATCGIAARSEHGQAFYCNFGRDAGMTCDECEGLWYDSAINSGDFNLCLNIISKLPRPEWRHIYSTKMLNKYSIKLRVPNQMDCLLARYREFGARGILDSIFRRLHGRYK